MKEASPKEKYLSSLKEITQNLAQLSSNLEESGSDATDFLKKISSKIYNPTIEQILSIAQKENFELIESYYTNLRKLIKNIYHHNLDKIDTNDEFRELLVSAKKSLKIARIEDIIKQKEQSIIEQQTSENFCLAKIIKAKLEIDSAAKIVKKLGFLEVAKKFCEKYPITNWETNYASCTKLDDLEDLLSKDSQNNTIIEKLKEIGKILKDSNVDVETCQNYWLIFKEKSPKIFHEDIVKQIQQIDQIHKNEAKKGEERQDIVIVDEKNGTDSDEIISDEIIKEAIEELIRSECTSHRDKSLLETIIKIKYKIHELFDKNLSYCQLTDFLLNKQIDGMPWEGFFSLKHDNICQLLDSFSSKNPCITKDNLEKVLHILKRIDLDREICADYWLKIMKNIPTVFDIADEEKFLNNDYYKNVFNYIVNEREDYLTKLPKDFQRSYNSANFNDDLNDLNDFNQISDDFNEISDVGLNFNFEF